MDLELGRFEPFLDQTGFDRGRCFWPPLFYTRRPGRRSSTRRPCQQSFKANRSRTRSNRASERGGRRHGGSLDFAIFRPLQPTLTSLPPFLHPLWSFSSDSSPFERYDENKFGRWLDRVFRPPQRLLDQGKGTSVFLVSWAFR